jgi:flagellar basal-body rod modification protein FlgD
MSNVASLTSTANTVNSVANTTNPLGNLVNAIGSAGAASSAASSASSTSTTLGSNFNTFLTLLTTQLQNQDPLSPLDTNAFTQQLVEFSQVEQQINTNNNLTSLISLQSQSGLITSQSLVGKTGEFSSANAPLVNGAAAFSYTLPSTAAQTTLAVTNAQGSIVWAGTGQTSAGTHAFSWNGDDINGSAQPPGVYTLQVVATGADGSTITPTIASFATIDQVTSQNGTTTFSAGGASYPIGQLIGVQNQAS